MRKRHELHPEQDLLFQNLPSSGGLDTHVETWKDQIPDQTTPATDEIPTVIGKPGSYVDLADRAGHLGEALTAFGLRNQRLGFMDAAEIPPSRKPIWGRYARGTQRVIDGAERKEGEFLATAKKEFWQATGIAAMKGAGIVDDHTANALGRSMWRNFSTKHGNPGAENTKVRNKAKRLYVRQVKQQTKLKDNSNPVAR